MSEKMMLLINFFHLEKPLALVVVNSKYLVFRTPNIKNSIVRDISNAILK